MSELGSFSGGKRKSDFGAVRAAFDPTETLVQPNDSALHADFRPSEAIVLAAKMPSP
jgi:hypothetical protein